MKAIYIFSLIFTVGSVIVCAIAVLAGMVFVRYRRQSTAAAVTPLEETNKDP